MGLRLRTFLALATTLCILVLGIYQVTHHFLDSSFSSIEKETLRRNSDRYRDALKEQIDSLRLRTLDYANWDDMYKYVNHPSRSFERSNLCLSTLQNIKIDFLMVFKSNHQLRYDIFYDVPRSKLITTSIGVQKAIFEIQRSQIKPEGSKQVVGITSQDGQLYAVSISAIQPSEGTAPVQGYIAMGYAITDRRIQELNALTHLQADIMPYKIAKDPLAIIPHNKPPDADEVRFNLESEQIAKTYRLVDNIDGNKVICLVVNSKRDIYAQFKNAERWLLIVSLFVGTICTLMALIIIEKMILRRILSLNYQSVAITSSTDENLRLMVKGKDELAKLALTINNMLDALNDQKTELTQANKQLIESEDRYQLVIKGSKAGIFEWNIVDGEISFTETVRDLLGWSRQIDRFPINKLSEMIHPDDIVEARGTVQRHIVSGEPFHIDFRLVNTDGSFKWIHATGQVATDSEKRPYRIVGSVTDITAKKMAEAELMRFFLLVEHSEDFIAMATMDGQVFYVNPAGCKKVGLGAFSGDTNTSIIDYYPEDVHNRIVKEILPSVLAQQKWEGEIEFRNHTSGEVMLMHEVIFFVPDPATGKPACFGTVARDITQERKTTAELAIARDAALESSRTKAMFLANMSHEIRTPMNGIIGMTELLLETKLDTDQRDYAKIVRTSSESLLSIINDILDFSKIEAGKFQIENIDFNLRDVLEEAVRLLASNAFGKGLELACRIPPGTPDHFRGDPMRIRQVVLNLLGNAIKFTSNGHVLLEVAIEEERNHSVVVISVEDTGIGIPEDRQHKIFDSFTQADGSSSRKYGGSGLGLTISKQITELMGGSIHIQSEPGKGSKFWIRVPLEVRETKKQKPKIVSNENNGLVLVVDDNETNRLILREYLRAWKFDVVDAESGLKAIELIQNDDSFTPVAILMDMQMPEMDGMDTSTHIRQIDRFVDIPIVIVTSAGRNYTHEELAEAGITSFIHKPIIQSQLYDALMSILFNESDGVTEKATLSGIHDLPLRGLNFLLVEDNVVNQKVATKILEKIGCSVDIAENGRIAVEFYQANHYDMILMDCQMPEMDGYAATREIRRLEAESGKHQPIIAMTAGAMEGDRDKCLEAGMDSYISKPVRPNELLDVVRPWVHLASSPVQESYESADAFDSSRLIEACTDDEDFMVEIATEFCEAAKEQLKLMREAIDQHDNNRLMMTAHTLKGSSRTIGGIALASVCEELELCARNEVEAGLEGIMDRADTAYLHLSFALQRLTSFRAA